MEYPDELDDRDETPFEFSDSPEGETALDRWAEEYYENDGPEGDWDR